VSSFVLEMPFDLDAVPDAPAVFLVHVDVGRPYLGRTARLRRRLKRLLDERPTASRLLSLRNLAVRVEYHPTASRLASSLLFYELARHHFPEDYVRLVKLRPPAWLKVLLANEYPRTQISTRLSASGAFHYGPFRSRASAERFESEVLNLFQVRRCQEDLVVSPDHPGCIYGEMNRCLRPCQEVVSRDEYASEVERLVEFLRTQGDSLLRSLHSARERASELLEFEEALRLHARTQRIEQVLRLRDELAAEAGSLHGVAVTPATEIGFVELRFFLGGWLPAMLFRVAPESSGEMVPLDRRLRETVAVIGAVRIALKQRNEHFALLTRWFYSSSRDGEWIAFPSLDQIPYRALVRAISRTAASAHAMLF
jgi:excinuclease ABC subunit C